MSVALRRAVRDIRSDARESDDDLYFLNEISCKHTVTLFHSVTGRESVGAVAVV